MVSRIFLLFMLATIFQWSCTTSKGPFASRSPHEKYSDGLKDAGLNQTQLGTAWLAVAGKALLQPQTTSLPYKETGFFAAEKPAATGYLFSVKRGEKILVDVRTVPASGQLFFAELWQRPSPEKMPVLLTTMDTLTRQLQRTAERDGQYIIRLQPELLRSVEYTITITTGPSLAFPVDRSGSPRMISFWGVERDGGSRSHEGVDISAKLRTPALAAADGYIGRVNENALGGKVVFLQDAATGNNLYYAHLDEQSVRQGQKVKAGDIIGLVGNTGNAKTTIPHLHFGIYTSGGAIDPIAFINNRQKEPKEVKAAVNNLHTWQRSTSNGNIYEQPSQQATIVQKTNNGDALFITAAADTWYKVLLPGGQAGYISNNFVTSKPLQEQKIKENKKLLDAPTLLAPSKVLIAAGTNVSVIGHYQNYSLVEHNNIRGWMMK